ncbi:hypothetical protein LZ31DRAFT_189482 [Colletotrichum somersetense]|nr:hypothetical protein LZ31DRAFT_189482 [Colletotrichum somersetense]
MMGISPFRAAAKTRWGEDGRSISEGMPRFVGAGKGTLVYHNQAIADNKTSARVNPFSRNTVWPVQSLRPHRKKVGHEVITRPLVKRMQAGNCGFSVEIKTWQGNGDQTMGGDSIPIEVWIPALPTVRIQTVPNAKEAKKKRRLPSFNQNG